MQRKLLSWMFIFVALIFQCSSASAFDPGSWERAGAITGNVTLSVVSPTFNTIDSTSGSVTVTLPDAASVKGKPLAFKKIAGTNSVTLTRAGSDTLEGSVSISFSSSIQNQIIVIESDGTTTWRVLQNSAPPNGGTSGQIEQANGAGTVKTWITPASSNLSDGSNLAKINASNSWSAAQYPNANTVNLGQDGTTWNDIYFKNSGTSTHKITATTPTADRTFALPNANSNPVQPASGASGQYVTGIDSAGVISFGTPSGGTSCDGRLTLTSGTPVTTSDVTAATNVYYCPYNGNKVAHSDGSSVYHNTFSQITISLSGKAANTNFDVVIYDSNGDGIDDTGELLQWSNNTTRATSITYSLGIPVKSGTVARTFVGTIRTTGTTGQCEDSLANRFVWNNSNRVVRPMSKTSSGTTWTYSTKTWRQMNGGTGSVRASFVTGLAEDAISATSTNFSSHSNANRQSYCGIGLDSTSTNVALTGQYFFSNNSSTIGGSQASYSGIPSIGSHTLYPLEAGNGSTTTTFYGSGSDAFLIPGITASYPM